MKIIISPAKTMRDQGDGFHCGQFPVLLEKTERLLEVLRTFSIEELMMLMKCNRRLAELNFQRFQQMDLKRSCTPALFSYDGLQYKSMAPNVFTNEEYAYIQRHLIILSGFYGLLRPDDAVRFYRLEMQTPLAVDGCEDLYEFWKETIYQQLFSSRETVINLASKEYSKVIEPYLKKNDRMIECIFGILVEGQVKVKGTLAKMARGSMVRWMAENQIEKEEDIKAFHEQGFEYEPAFSNDRQWIFLKK